MFEIPIGTLAEEKEAELAKVTPFTKVLLNSFIVPLSIVPIYQDLAAYLSNVFFLFFVTSHSGLIFRLFWKVP